MIYFRRNSNSHRGSRRHHPGKRSAHCCRDRSTESAARRNPEANCCSRSRRHHQGTQNMNSSRCWRTESESLSLFGQWFRPRESQTPLPWPTSKLRSTSPSRKIRQAPTEPSHFAYGERKSIFYLEWNTSRRNSNQYRSLGWCCHHRQHYTHRCHQYGSESDSYKLFGWVYSRRNQSLSQTYKNIHFRV